MKTKRTVYIILGCLFFFLNVCAYLNLLVSKEFAKSTPPGFFIGFNFFFYLSALFFFLAWRTGRKSKNSKVEELINTLPGTSFSNADKNK